MGPTSWPPCEKNKQRGAEFVLKKVNANAISIRKNEFSELEKIGLYYAQ